MSNYGCDSRSPYGNNFAATDPRKLALSVEKNDLSYLCGSVALKFKLILSCLVF
jgi:hypothetical protein